MALSLPFPFLLSMRQPVLKNVVKFDLSKRPSLQEGPNWPRKGNLLHDICPLLQRNDKTSATPTLQATPACSTGKSDQLQGLTGHTKVGNTVRVAWWLNERRMNLQLQKNSRICLDSITDKYSNIYWSSKDFFFY